MNDGGDVCEPSCVVMLLEVLYQTMFEESESYESPLLMTIILGCSLWPYFERWRDTRLDFISVYQ